MGELYEQRADYSRSAVALYIQLATLFRRRIESGQWAVGKQIPTVDELADQCGVARATIRQAVGLLETEGLVVRYRAKGTFVRARPQDQLWCEVETDWSGLLSSREGATIEILSREVAMPPFVPHEIGELAPSYLHLRRRHWRNNQAFLLADVYIDERLAKKLPEEAFTTKTAMRLASSIPGDLVAGASQTLTIGAADIEMASALEIPLNAPICHVNRSVVDQRGGLVLIANGTYRGDVVRLEIKLK